MTAPPVLWAPSADDLDRANVTRFIGWLEAHEGLRFDDYAALWRWSVTELEAFWDAVWRFYGLRSPEPYTAVLSSRAMPGASWFDGARLNYAEEVLGRASAAHPALVALDERGALAEVSLAELRGQVGALAAALRSLGVQTGDRVAAYVPNIREAVVALLATTSLGAVWTACAPDFGTRSVIDRFGQVEPTVLIAVDGYRFNGRAFDRRDAVAEIQAALPSLRATILVRSLEPDAAPPAGLGAQPFDALVAEPQEPTFTAVAFDHPLWILYSSGTTGLPKGIVQGHGGIVVEHLKSLGLCAGLQEGDRWFLHSSTSWMAWNWLVGGLLHGATCVLYDGSPGHPHIGTMWERAAQARAHTLLVGSAYVQSCIKAGVTLADVDLDALRVLNATGSPLSDQGWAWLRAQLNARVRIESTCGGTDVCTAFFGGTALQPVYLGEISGAWLGIAAEAWDAEGRPVVDAPGEFVVTAPMPSMPLRFWNDADGARLQGAYFDTYPGIWRQGDSITITSRGTVRVWGRSDATINRGGVRFGWGVIYSVIEGLAEVADGLVVGVELADGGYYLPLFVVPADGHELDDALRARIVAALRSEASPRHVPDEIVEAPAIPRTLTGKKLEVPVKRILQGASAHEAASTGSIDRPDALAWFERFAHERG